MVEKNPLQPDGTCHTLGKVLDCLGLRVTHAQKPHCRLDSPGRGQHCPQSHGLDEGCKWMFNAAGALVDAIPKEEKKSRSTQRLLGCCFEAHLLASGRGKILADTLYAKTPAKTPAIERITVVMSKIPLIKIGWRISSKKQRPKAPISKAILCFGVRLTRTPKGIKKRKLNT